MIIRLFTLWNNFRKVSKELFIATQIEIKHSQAQQTIFVYPNAIVFSSLPDVAVREFATTSFITPQI